MDKKLTMFNRQKKLFKQKIKDVQDSIYEVEFKIFKSRQLREESRLLRDRCVENVAQIEARLQGTKDKEEKGRLEEELKAHKENKEKYEGQMKMVDEQINGGEGQPGLLEHIKGLTELKTMYKDYLKII